MMRLPDVTAVMVQPMLKGQELFLGAKYEDRFGHVVLCGLGGIFVEVLKDVSYGLSPLSYDETYSMIRSLRGYPIIKGTRGQRGVDEQQYAGYHSPPVHIAPFCIRNQGNGHQSSCCD